VETESPVWAAAPGQACALYDGDICLGGGRIARDAVVETSEPTSSHVAALRAAG
jgi:hypothetical protein